VRPGTLGFDRRKTMQLAVSGEQAASAPRSPGAEAECAGFAPITACFEHVLCQSGILPHDDFFELGGDSASAVELALEIEHVTGIALPMTAAFDAPTPAEMARLVESYRGREAGAPVLLKAGTGQAGLFLFPGAGGAASGLRPFALALDTDMPVYGFDTPGLNGKQPPLDRVQALAAHHLPRLRAVQPHGPYRLAGYSVGGLVAYELAQMLARQGERVALVGLIDTVVSRVHYGWPAILRIWARRARQHLLIARRLSPLRAVAYASARLRSVVPDIVPPTRGAVVRPGSVSDAGAEANRRYVPRRFDGRVVLLWSEALAEHNSLDIVWRTRARRLEVHRLPGDHDSVIGRDVAFASAAFSAALQQTRPASSAVEMERIPELAS